MSSSLFWLNFLYSFLATVIGGGVLALIFFWLREKIFTISKVEGRWFFEMRTVHTAYNPYKRMTLRYVAMLWREGSRIEGTVEKIYESSSTGIRSYVGNNRTRGRVSGFVEKNYFSKDRVKLHVVENGHGRESTNYYDLTADSNHRMYGTFHSMVADQDGDVNWQREEF